MTVTLNGLAPLTHLGVIRVKGDDAVSFLQGQLTQDFALLKPGEARLAAYCTAKGRMQASFIGFKTAADEVLLICSHDLLAATLKRLSMFVLRAKAKLSDATADHRLLGVAGDAMTALVGEAPVPWGLHEVSGGHLVTLYPADGQARGLWVGPLSAAAPTGAALPPDAWLWSEVRSGVATVSTPIAEAFVPQMLNYESVGGVNFKKGCYPGQEVVARSQFRGTLKRRAYLVHAKEPLVAGQEVFHESDAEQPVGLVAQAHAVPAGGCDAIVSMQVSAAQGGRLTAGSPDGPTLELQQLPYLLLDDV